MTEKQTQKEEILAYLQTGEKLTWRDAFYYFGCVRLAARIEELRREGHNIESRLIPVAGKQVAEYWLVVA